MKIKISDDEILELIQPDIDQAEDWARQLSEERKRCSDLYNREKLGNEQDGFSQHVAAVVFDTINWLLPGLDAIFTHPDFFTVLMENNDRAEKNKKLLRNQLFSQQDGATQLLTYMEVALRYHNGVIKVWFDEQYDTMSEEFDELNQVQFATLQQNGYQAAKFDQVETMQEDGTVIVTYQNVKMVKREEIFRGPRVEALPPWEFLISPGAKSIDDARVVIHRTRKTIDEITRKERSGVYRKGSASAAAEEKHDDLDVPELREEWEAIYTTDDLDVADIEGNSFDTDNERLGPGMTVFVDEIHTRLDIDGDGLLENVIIRKTGTVILSVEESPYRRPPFRAGKLFNVPFRFEGAPLPLHLESDQREMTNLRRIFTDASAEAAYGTMVTSDATFANQWAKRTIGDTLLHPSLQAGAYDNVKPDAPGKTILDAIEMKRTDYERTSGVNSLNQGLTADSMGKTATGTMALQNAGQQRQKFYAKLLGGPLKKVLKDMMWINQTWPPKEAFTLIGKDAIQITPEDLQGRHDIEIEVGVGPQDRMQQAQVLEQHFQKLAKALIPAGVAGPEHLIRTERKIGKLMGVSVDDLQFSDEEFNTLQRMQQTIQQLQGQLQQLTGGMNAQRPGQGPGAQGIPGGAIPARGAGPQAQGQPVLQQGHQGLPGGPGAEHPAPVPDGAGQI
jgi:hypothetical protein